MRTQRKNGNQAILLEVFITAEPPFSSCTSSVIDFWHYKTSFTTILSNFCQVQPGTIHNPADLTKKRHKLWQHNSDTRCTSTCKRAPTSSLGWGSNTSGWVWAQGRSVLLLKAEQRTTDPPTTCLLCTAVGFSSLNSCKLAPTERWLHCEVPLCCLHICDFHAVSLTSNCLREKRLKLKYLPLVTHFMSYLVKYKDLFNSK